MRHLIVSSLLYELIQLFYMNTVIQYFVENILSPIYHAQAKAQSTKLNDKWVPLTKAFNNEYITHLAFSADSTYLTLRKVFDVSLSVG